MKKENQTLKEKNGFAERDLVLLQEEYDSIKGKLEKCAMANEKLLESNNSLKVRMKIVIILRAARNCWQPHQPLIFRRPVCLVLSFFRLDTVQDFLIKLGIKPRMHLQEMSIFSTKSCHRQTFQNYEQSRQKLGTFLEKKVL